MKIFGFILLLLVALCCQETIGQQCLPFTPGLSRGRSGRPGLPFSISGRRGRLGFPRLPGQGGFPGLPGGGAGQGGFPGLPGGGAGGGGGAPRGGGLFGSGGMPGLPGVGGGGGGAPTPGNLSVVQEYGDAVSQLTKAILQLSLANGSVVNQTVSRQLDLVARQFRDLYSSLKASLKGNINEIISSQVQLVVMRLRSVATFYKNGEPSPVKGVIVIITCATLLSQTVDTYAVTGIVLGGVFNGNVKPELANPIRLITNADQKIVIQLDRFVNLDVGIGLQLATAKITSIYIYLAVFAGNMNISDELLRQLQTIARILVNIGNEISGRLPKNVRRNIYNEIQRIKSALIPTLSETAKINPALATFISLQITSIVSTSAAVTTVLYNTST